MRRRLTEALPMKTLAERLTWARTKQGLMRNALDEKAGLSEGHVAAIERGDRENPSAATAGALATALGVDLEWLVNGGKRKAST